MKSLLEKLSVKFPTVELKDNKIVFKTFYKNGNVKEWYSISEIDNGEFRLIKGGFQLRDGSSDFILGCCLNYIN